MIDRFEWENPNHWHNSGLWDFDKDEAGDFRRVLNPENASEFWHSQAKLAAKGYGAYPTFGAPEMDGVAVRRHVSSQPT